MKRLTLIALTTILTACATGSVSPSYMPDGTQGYQVLSYRDWGAAYEKAAEFCHGPYNPIDRNAETHCAPTGCITNYRLLFKCK